MVNCWVKKGKYKYNDVGNRFVGDIFCVEVQEDDKEEDHKSCLRDNGASLHITYNKKYMTYVEKFKINAIVGNYQKMKYDLKAR